METKKCPECGAVNNLRFRFCKNCGVLLIDPLPLQQTTNQSHKNQSIRQMGQQGTAFFSFYDPFDGYGERGRFVPWLLSNLGDKAELLRDAVTQRFIERQIPNTKIIFRRLSGKGMLTETREYYLAQRKSINIGLYISRFGKDLYISMVTYFKGQISPGRVLILTLMVLLLALFFITSNLVMVDYLGISAATQTQDTQMQGGTSTFYLLQVLNDTISSFSQTLSEILGFLMVVTCCLGPLITLDSFALSLGILYSLYRGFTDKDPWVLLRSQPNEFQQDDIVALEIAVEETVRQALDSIGIDSTVMPPSPEKGWRERLI